MNRFHIKAAYTEQPIPPDLPETERAAYIALTVIYPGATAAAYCRQNTLRCSRNSL